MIIYGDLFVLEQYSANKNLIEIRYTSHGMAEIPHDRLDQKLLTSSSPKTVALTVRLMYVFFIMFPGLTSLFFLSIPARFSASYSKSFRERSKGSNFASFFEIAG